MIARQREKDDGTVNRSVIFSALATLKHARCPLWASPAEAPAPVLLPVAAGDSLCLVVSRSISPSDRGANYS